MNDLLYQLALTLVPNIGDVHAKILIQHLGYAQAVFAAKQNILEKIEGIGSVRARSIKEFDAFKTAEDEIKFIEKYKIKTLFITDPDYPKRLLNCYVKKSFHPPNAHFFGRQCSSVYSCL